MDSVERKLSLVEIQKYELEIAKEIKKICENNNIQYFLIGGTLLGAVRHRGFIPWDDDMDIGMTFENYVRFIKVAKKQLNSRFALQHWDDGTAYSYPFAKVKMVGTRVTEKVNRNLNIDKGIWVDVFPYYLSSKEFAKSRKNMLMLQCLSKLMLLKRGYDLNSLATSKRVKVINCILKYAPLSSDKARNILVKKIRNQGIGNMDYYIECDGMFKGNFVFPQEYFSRLIPIQFENEIFLAPEKYHEYLSDAYGDYMKLPSIEEQQRGHSLIETVIVEEGEIL